MGTETVSGIAQDRVDRWLADHVAELSPPLRYELIAGGRSNLTYYVLDANEHRVVLRRPPLGAVLQSAHDMGREHRIISALAPTAVPVPTPLAFCDDPEVTGAPFYVMERVDGVILRDADDVPEDFGEPARAQLARSIIDVLACLALLEPDDVGLGDLGRRDGYVERQLRRWHAQFEKSRSREVAEVDEVHRRLASHVPPQQRTAIVHGDYRIENCILAPDGTVRAVLDWELCTLGDPLADLGWLVAYWTQPGEDAAHMNRRQPTVLAGFPGRAAIVERYVERTGLDASALDFYVALGLWKLACIAEGVYARYRAGVMGAQDTAVTDRFGRQVQALARAALDVSERLR
jgi:aminoglycoside phosphotransferase (APT) family kinase protein